VVGKIRDLILQLSKSSIYSTKPDAGLTGKISPHSLRYAYSREATEYHMQRGFSKKEAEALVSMDLGHGDGRGHYVARVYNKGEPHDD
ncbi:integrase domain-containing protein, partial [Klebsiella pneumoniae]